MFINTKAKDALSLPVVSGATVFVAAFDFVNYLRAMFDPSYVVFERKVAVYLARCFKSDIEIDLRVVARYKLLEPLSKPFYFTTRKQ